jgi:hypothetical protein
VGTTIRRWLAPAFRKHVLIVYGAVIAIFLILVAWAPVSSDRRLIGTILLLALILFGIEILRRQTLREFPEQGAVAPPAPPATRPS